MGVFLCYWWVKVVVVGGLAVVVVAEGETMVMEVGLQKRTMKRRGGCFRVYVPSRDAMRCRFRDGSHSDRASGPVRDRG